MLSLTISPSHWSQQKCSKCQWVLLHRSILVLVSRYAPPKPMYSCFVPVWQWLPLLAIDARSELWWGTVLRAFSWLASKEDGFLMLLRWRTLGQNLKKCSKTLIFATEKKTHLFWIWKFISSDKYKYNLSSFCIFCHFHIFMANKTEKAFSLRGCGELM